MKICSECLEKSDSSYSTKWLERKTKTLKKQLDDVEKKEFYNIPIEQLNEIELLVMPDGSLAEDKIKKLRSKRVGVAMEGSKIPNCFRKKVKDSLFQKVCDYFSSELKDNNRVQVIFNSQLLAKISAESEDMKITLEQIVTSLHDISKNEIKLKNAIYTFEEYIENFRYIKRLLDYEIFIGRKDELNKLHTFLETDNDIMVMYGEGGVGKTKLSLEFAKQLTQMGEWNIYFLDPYIIEFDNLPYGDKILIILDDATDITKRNEFINSLSRHLGTDLKLLLINRPIYNESIKKIVTQDNFSPTFLPVGKGDIISFLKAYCDWLDDNTAKKINEKCLNSFDFAFFFAEYYKEKGEIGDVDDVIDRKAKLYIEDIATVTNQDPVDVRKAIKLLSLLTPFHWDDLDNLEKIRGLRSKSKSLERVLEYVEDHKSDILYYSDNDFVIKPDPLADFLRAEFLNEDTSNENWRRLFPYMALRISINTFVLPRYDSKNEMRAIEVLSQMWEELNNTCGKNPEYFSAITFFTGDLSQTSLFDVNKINIKHWLNCYKEISKHCPEDETVRKQLAMGLVNATSDYGRKDLWAEMKEVLEELRGINEKNPQDETVREKLAMGLVNEMNQSKKQSYENLHLLYKLRFNLPDDERKENIIKQIENTYIEETQNAIKSEYNKNNGNVTDFVKNLQSIFEDDNELIILIYRIAENLPETIQESLYETLDELGL